MLNFPFKCYPPITADAFFQYSGLYIFTDANVSSVFTHCNQSMGQFPCMDGKTCYTYQDICNGNARCAVDHRDEMGCKQQPTSCLKHQTIFDKANDLFTVCFIYCYKESCFYIFIFLINTMTSGFARSTQSKYHHLRFVLFLFFSKETSKYVVYSNWLL